MQESGTDSQEPQSQGNSLAPAQELAEELFEPLPANTIWHDVRCFKCKHLQMRISAIPIAEGINQAVKIGLDLKCRICKEINYRLIVV